MRFLMLGAGGIGAYYAARLIDGGEDVVLTARGAHLAAMQAGGLDVEHADFVFQGAVSALDHAALRQRCRCGDFDLIMIGLKSGATAALLDELGDWLDGADTPVLSLQNGVDNEPQLAARLGGPRVWGGIAMRIGGHLVAPGKVDARGPGEIIMGAWPDAAAEPATQARCARIAPVFDRCGIPTTVSEDVRCQLWRKLVLNNAVNPLSALTGMDTGALSHHPVLSKTVYTMMREAVRASHADGVNLGQQDLDELFAIMRAFQAIKTSMQVDREKGRPLELAEIPGAVLRRIESLGETAPVTELVLALLQEAVVADARA